MEKNQMEYQLVYNSFRDQILHKQMQLDKLQYQFNNKISNCGKQSQKHQAQFVKFCRTMMQEFDRIYADIRSYFVQLKLDFSYQILYKMFKMNICSFKMLSQYYVRSLKVTKKSITTTFQSIDIDNYQISEQEKRKKIKKKHLKQMQHINFILRDIEEEEKKISKQKQQAEKYFYNKKQSIENTGPSQAIAQLQQLKKNIDRIVENSQRMFDQNYLYRHQQLRNRIMTVKSPSQLDQIFRKQIFGNMKIHFSKAIESAILTLLNILKARQKQTQNKLKLLKKAQQINSQTQTIDDKNSILNKTPKQIQRILMDFQLCKKQNKKMQNQLYHMKNDLDKSKVVNLESQNKISIIQQMLKKRSLQLQQAKFDLEWTTNRRDQTISDLNQKIRKFKKQAYIQEKKTVQQQTQCYQTDFVVQEVQTSQVFDIQSEIQSKSKSKVNNSRKTQKLQGIYLQRQLKMSKSQNSVMRRSLSVIIGKLNQKQLIFQYPLRNLDDDIRAKTLVNKIQGMKMEIQDKLKTFVSKQLMKLKESQTIQMATQTTSNNNLTKPFQNTRNRISIQSSRKGGLKKNTKIVLNVQDQRDQSVSSFNILSVDKTSGSHLQKLKKQLVEKVSSSRRNIPKSTFRGLKDYISDQQSLPINFSPDNFSKTQLSKYPQRKTEKKPSFMPKDISFEQLDLTQNKGISQLLANNKRQKSMKNIQQSKFQSKATTRKYIQDQIPIISAENIGNWTDANKIMHYVQKKNDEKDLFFKKFMKSLMLQVRKRKGDRFMKQIFNSASRNSGIVKAQRQIIFEGCDMPKQQSASKRNQNIHKTKNNRNKSIFSGLR